MRMRNNMATSKLYLGLDFSTQQLKPIVIDDSLSILTEYEDCSVSFDSISKYNTCDGFIEENDTVTAPTLMWVEALQIVLDKLQSKSFPFEKVAALSTSGQQHGSVYWRTGSEDILKLLDPSQTLVHQLKDAFSIPRSPIWKDSSTTNQCHQLESKCGGPLMVARKTGSRAYERFTGNQIAKLASIDSANINDTERISLVSSFGVTLFCGCYAPIDYSDGSGMNLLDIHSKDWWQEALDVCCPNLKDKLGQPVPASTVVGNISMYYVKRYGFDANCKIVAGTGDNPSSLAGMRLQEGDVGVSLGTSDTVFLWITQPDPQLMGHTFINPVDSSAYMAMLCYQNGSLTRERIRNEHANGDWNVFDQLMNCTPPGNDGYIGFYYDKPEIAPPVKDNDYLYGPNDSHVPSLLPVRHVRAVVEGQLLAKYVHSRSLGYRITSTSRIIATGGAAQNKTILQILANIFNANVYTCATSNSASLGAAYRAKHALMGASFTDAIGSGGYDLQAQPDAETHFKIYQPMVERVDKLLSKLPTFK